MVEFNNSLLAKVAAKTLEKFKSLDKNGDGYVSREEFQNSILDTYNNNGKQLQGAHAQGSTIGDVLAGQDARFKQFDTAKDPKSKGLDFDEFSAMFKDEIYMEVKKNTTTEIDSSKTVTSERQMQQAEVPVVEQQKEPEKQATNEIPSSTVTEEATDSTGLRMQSL